MKNTYGLEPEYFERYLQDRDWADPANVKGADAATWQLLNHAWAVDAKSVYLQGKKLKDVDRASFRVLNELFARDETRVFCAEGLSCVPDAATFEAFGDNSEEAFSFRGYARDAGHVYYAAVFNPASIVKGADAASFVELAQGYARDSKALFFEGKRVRGATPDNFEVFNDQYVRAGDGVFFAGRRMEHALAAQFRLVNADQWLWRDDARLYRFGDCIEGADPASFVMLSDSIGRDARQVYVHGKAVPGIDIASFVHLGFDYFRDRKDYYWAGEPLEFVHRKSFVATGNGTGRDKHREIYKTGKHTNSLDERRADLPRQSVLWSLLKVLGLMFFAVAMAILNIPRYLWEKFRARSKPVVESDYSEAARDVVVLAKTVAMGNQAALEPVLLAAKDMDAFREKYLGRESYAEEPDYEEMMGRLGDPEDEDVGGPHPFLVFETVFSHYGLLGVIDWRSDTDETRVQVDPMLARFGIEDFDWSFIEVLTQHGKGPELANNNFLSILRDELAKLELKLAHVNLMGDSYGFVVVKLADFAAIDGLGDHENFSVSDEFGSDKDYKRGKEILERNRS